MLSDFFFVFSWWALFFGLGIVFFPLTWKFFNQFFDRGYLFSKIISVLIASYLVWLWGSLKILPFTAQTIWLAIILAAGINFLLLRQNQKKFKKEIKSNWKIFLFEETLFFASLALWSFIRGFQPNIQGLEKFMDYGFVNTILRSRYFPPADMWLAGETINYYYFGHLVTAVLTKLSGIDSAITYNLMMATLFAFTFTAGFSLGGNLIYTSSKFKTLNPKQYQNPKSKFSKRFEFRLFGNFILFRIPACLPTGRHGRTGRSNLGFRILLGGILTACLLTLGGNLHPLWWFLKHGNFAAYWYPDATRFIVQQFGAADNTIHEFPIYSFVVADLHGHLLNLPFVLLFLALVLKIFIEKTLSFLPCCLVGLLLAVFYMTNAWDLPIYFSVFGATILWFNYLKHGLKIKTLSHTLTWAGGCLLLALLFSSPFHLHFQSIAQGLAPVDFHSPPWMLLVLWGFPLFATLSFLFFLKTKEIAIEHLDGLILIILTIAWFLILIPEIIYLKDIYIHSHQRANTMFKLTYQSFVIFSLAGGYITIRGLTAIKQGLFKFILFTFCFLLFASLFIYPYFAIRSYYGLKDYQGLYGLSHLERAYPDDYQAILWLKKHVSGQPVMAEAVGESYTDFARVSANTGLPTILGWRVHEWLWRGSFDEPGKRTEAVKTIYESPDLDQTKQLLSQHQTQLIFVGHLERQQYPNLQEEKLAQLGEIIFSSGTTKIYQVTRSRRTL